MMLRNRLQAATQAYLDTNSQDLELYEGSVDSEFIEANGISLDIGDIIRVISTTFQIDNSYEIKELTQNIVNPNIYSIKFGDVLPKGLLAYLKQINFNTNQKIYSVEKNVYSSTQITNEINNLGQDLTWQNL